MKIANHEANTGIEMNGLLLQNVSVLLWRHRDFVRIMGDERPSSGNLFVLGPCGMDPIFKFFDNYTDFLFKCHRDGSLELDVLAAERSKLLNFYLLATQRSRELVDTLTLTDSRNECDPPGFRALPQAYKDHGHKLPVSNVPMLVFVTPHSFLAFFCDRLHRNRGS